MTIGTKGMPRFAVFMRGVARRRAWRSILFIVAAARTVAEWAVLKFSLEGSRGH